MAEQYRFPLTDTDKYAGRVSFLVRIEEPPTLGVSSNTKLKIEGSEAEGSTDEDFAKSAENFVSSLFTETSIKSKVSYGNKATLYLPSAIQLQDGVVYDKVDLGRIGAAVEAGLQNGASLATAFTNSFHDLVAPITDLFNKSLTPDAARLAVVRLAQLRPSKLLTPQGIQDGISSALRVTTNPNSRQLFKEVSLRSFSFQFRLVPVSQAEAEMSKKLVKFFRTELYPDDDIKITSKTGVTIPIGYRFPNSFVISFKHADKNILYKTLPCYLTAMSVSYNQTGAGFFHDGNFTEVDMNLSFRESSTLTKKLVRDEGY